MTLTFQLCKSVCDDSLHAQMSPFAEKSSAKQGVLLASNETDNWNAIQTSNRFRHLITVR